MHTEVGGLGEIFVQGKVLVLQPPTGLGEIFVQGKVLVLQPPTLCIEQWFSHEQDNFCT